MFVFIGWHTKSREKGRKRKKTKRNHNLITFWKKVDSLSNIVVSYLENKTNIHRIYDLFYFIFKLTGIETRNYRINEDF